ncbi:MAG: segregation/condensation protein A [Phycisphaeraceae bacterium]|nr:segregation/condensation protein A [Phycisphaeraceae bacterium]
MTPEPTLEDYRIDLDCYSGPLDLLLYLVKRHEVDLVDLPIARITEQYLAHLKLIQELDVDLAGEFLVMAAMLLEIKSQMLLPRPEEAAEPADAESGMTQTDPRFELVQQLLAYKKFKDAANELEARKDEWEQRFACHPMRKLTAERPALVEGEAGETEAAATDVDVDPDADEGPVEIDLDDANVLDLCEAFARILESIGKTPAMHEVVNDDTPIALHAEDIVDRLRREGTLTLQAIFVGRSSRNEMVGLFLAMLELVRQRQVRVLQDTPGSEIQISLQDEADAKPEDDKPRDWRNPQTGQIEFDWPSEFERRRAERRAKLRANYAQRFKQEPEPVDDTLSLEDELPAEDPVNEALATEDEQAGLEAETDEISDAQA